MTWRPIGFGGYALPVSPKRTLVISLIFIRQTSCDTGSRTRVYQPADDYWRIFPAASQSALIDCPGGRHLCGSDCPQLFTGWAAEAPRDRLCRSSSHRHWLELPPPAARVDEHALVAGSDAKLAHRWRMRMTGKRISRCHLGSHALRWRRALSSLPRISSNRSVWGSPRG